MKNLLEEEYVLSRMATGDFDQAKRSLLMVKRYKRPEVIIALIKDAIISYSRPFSSNRGGFRKKKLKIGNDVIPNDQRKFHNKILMIRNNLVAHTNLKYRNPKLVKVNEPPLNYPISYKSFYYEDLLELVEPLIELIEAVKSNTYEKIRSIENNHF